jgi:hypothetical protein
MITSLTRSEMTRLLWQELGMRSGTYDDALLLLQALRRMCGILCPNPRELIAAWTARSLSGLTGFADLDEEVNLGLDSLLIAGDIVEMTGEDAGAQVYLRAPAFMALDKHTYVFGIADDDAPFLPADLQGRLNYRGASRYLEGTDAIGILSELGLQKLTEAQWCRKFNPGTAREQVTMLRNVLAVEGTSEDLEVQKLLSHNGKGQGYQARWVGPLDQQGIHVFRVSRTYGSAAWLIGDFEQGRLKRFAHIPLLEAGGRPCDAAWLAQLALDAEAGRANSYRLTNSQGASTIALTFPLPTMAHRHLTFLTGSLQFGVGPQTPIQCPPEMTTSLESYLQKKCWTVRAV